MKKALCMRLIFALIGWFGSSAYAQGKHLALPECAQIKAACEKEASPKNCFRLVLKGENGVPPVDRSVVAVCKKAIEERRAEWKGQKGSQNPEGEKPE